MSIDDRPRVITTYKDAPARAVSAGGVNFAYRELGPKGGIPVIFFMHLAANLDNWDPRIIDAIAEKHQVIAFDNRGVGASSGSVPDTIEAMADDAVTFIRALGFDQVDLFAFSLGGMVAQVLGSSTRSSSASSSSPAPVPPGARASTRSPAITTYDVLRADVDPAGPEEVPLLQPNANGNAPRSRSSPVEGAHRRSRSPISPTAFPPSSRRSTAGAVHPGRPVGITQPMLIANGDDDRMVPTMISETCTAHPRQRSRHLPRLRPRRHLPVPRRFVPVALEFLAR